MRLVRRLRLTLFATAMAFAATSQAAPGHAAAPRLMRFPDIHGREVVFSYGGDLWIASIDGGQARQLTSGTGLELFPKFSPDGKWIAFTGEFTGEDQVYVIPASGGMPRQLTFYPALGPLPARSGYDNQVTGWSPDGGSILFRSLRDSPDAMGSRLYTVPAGGGDAVALPMARAGAGVFSPDGAKVLFSTTSRDFRSWKRYQGGWAQDLFIADLAAKTITNVTHDKRTDRDPMWTSRGIYFLSDRDGRLNLYRADPVSGVPRKLTHFTEGDAEFASADAAGNVVFQYEGTLHLYDGATDTDRVLQIDVPATDTAALPRMVKAGDQLEGGALSPNGRRLAFVARGDVFVMPADGKGATVNLTHSSGAHDRAIAWAPDSKTLAFVSDSSGDEELWTVAADGSSPRQLTHHGGTRYFRPTWSPDGRRVALIDKEGNLWVVDAGSGAMHKIGATRAWYLRDYEWSPDGRYLAFAEIQDTDLRMLKIWDAVTNAAVAVTDPMYDSFEPAWSPDGRYLWFLSVRDANLQIAETEWNFAPDRQTRIYALAMRRDVPNPFGFADTEETPPPAMQIGEPLAGQAPRDRPPSGPGDPATWPSTAVEGAPTKRRTPEHHSSPGRRASSRTGAEPIDFEGLAARLIRPPLDSNNYVDLHPVGNGLLYRVEESRHFGQGGTRGTLFSFNLVSAKASKIRDDVSGYDVDATGRTLLLRDSGGHFKVARLGADAIGDEVTVDLDRLTMRTVPREEWAEIFNEVWRRYRDYFYDPAMHGHDWAAIGDHYRKLLPTVSNRSDLNYLIGEMIGELNVSHAYVAGGPDEVPPRPRTGLLGARFTFDTTAAAWRIVKIFDGDNADPQYRSPLTEVGVQAGVGDYLLSIDGQPLDRTIGPYQALEGKAGQAVEITLRPRGGADRRVTVKTLDSETSLIRMERTLTARKLVARLSGGRVGYIHISDMSAAGLREFVKDWYGQIRSDGIVVDIRGNTGGNVSRMILERLLRPDYTRGFVRGLQIPQTYPWGGYTQAFTGELAMLVDETTMSDGDTMAWTFQQTKRGPLIGRRTWGGVIGGGDTGPLLDGGSVTVPQFALAGKEGQWIVEGDGVTPDIEVDFDQPAMRGEADAQLVAAVHTILQRLGDRHPGSLGGPRPYPVKP